MSTKDQWKYEKAYQLPNYHLQGQREIIVARDIHAIPMGSSYLDVGCGRGESIAMARGHGLTAKGTELVPALCTNDIVWADIEALPFEDGEFEYVSCYDVLEHLPPGTEQKALDELGRVASKQLILSTNDKPSCLPTGEDLHVNKRPHKEWHADILARWPDAKIDATVFGNNEWHWRIVFDG